MTSDQLDDPLITLTRRSAARLATLREQRRRATFATRSLLGEDPFTTLNPHACLLTVMSDVHSFSAVGREPTALESLRTITNSLRALPAVFSPALTRNPNSNAPAASSPSSQRSTALSYGQFVGPTPSSGPPDLRPQFAPDPIEERLTWASWDSLDTQAGPKRVLILAYEFGLQIWDYTSIDALQEILNVNISSFIARDGQWIVFNAIMLPTPPVGVEDELAASRPLMAVLAKDVMLSPELGPAEVVIYSLQTHAVVKRLGSLPLVNLRLDGTSSLEASQTTDNIGLVHAISATPDFVVLSTHTPLALHILASTTLETIYILPASALTPSPTIAPSPDVESPPSHPTFALSGRLLAFAAPPPAPHQRSRRNQALSSSVASSVSPSIQGGVELVGSGAKIVGEGLVMGMKALSGFAFGTAGNGAGTNSPSPQGPLSSPGLGFYPRSLPSAGASPPHGMLNLSPPSPMTPLRRPTTGESVLHPPPPVEHGYVRVLDLHSLIPSSSNPSPPATIAHFLSTSSTSYLNSQVGAVHHLSFSPSGTMLCVADSQGYVIKLFQLLGSLRPLRPPTIVDPADEHTQQSGSRTKRPMEATRRRSSGGGSTASSLSSRGGHQGTVPSKHAVHAQDAVRHLYDLTRGQTSGSVEVICWTEDARWIGVGTARGTLHLFAVNPFGGKPDEASHLDGRVRNASTMPSWPFALQPVIRLKATAKEGSPAPTYCLLSQTISKSSSILSPSLDRPSTRSSIGRSVSAPTLDPSGIYGRTGFQDVLAFSPATALLTLRRCTISVTPPSNSTSTVSRSGSQSVARTSADFGRSGVSMMMNLVGSGTVAGPSGAEPTLKASETLVASWDVKREGTWEEVKDAICPKTAPEEASGTRTGNRADSLSQAELSTSSSSPLVLPPSIYSSHQFNFYSLGDDWHVQLRQTQFDIASDKLTVRKEVEVISGSPRIGSPSRALPTHTLSEEHETFVQAAEPSSLPAMTASIMENPLQSALHTNIDPSQTSPAVIPSFPNAFKPSSWRDSTIVPVRQVATSVADGVGEGIGRIKREITKSRVASPTKDDDVPPLAFDDDASEAFDRDGPLPAYDERRMIEPLRHPRLESVDDTASEAWSAPDEEMQRALDEEARFDEIGVSAFVREDAEADKLALSNISTASMTKSVSKKKGKAKKGKRR